MISERVALAAYVAFTCLDDGRRPPPAWECGGEPAKPVGRAWADGRPSGLGTAMETEGDELPYKEPVLAKMESLVREMQHPDTGVPVRSQKLFLTSIPSAFLGEYTPITMYTRVALEEAIVPSPLPIPMVLSVYRFEGASS